MVERVTFFERRKLLEGLDLIVWYECKLVRLILQVKGC